MNVTKFTNIRLFSTTTTYFSNDRAVRVRFAPSPTGNIHLGGLRTALYNYVFAKQNGGKFILRIEDTDQTRIVPGSAEEIEEVLNWAGLKPDESPSLGGYHGPYSQSARLDFYRRRANELLESNEAYRCFCSPERLDLLRKHQAKNREKPRYDGKCKNLSPAEIKEKLDERGSRHVLRFALSPGSIVFDDLIFGSISNDLVGALDSDPVILKSDNFPTYHFANVVDDHEMEISHVLRGSEWISSTAKHVQIYRAFGWAQPKFAHFPLITMRDGSKMSKRNNQSHIKSWRDAGYRPRAILNFLTNMGGGMPKAKQDSMEVWDLERIVEYFNFNHVTCHPGSVDLDRLNRYNSNDLKKSWEEDTGEVLSQFRSLLERNSVKTDLDDNQLTTIINHFIQRVVTLNDLLSHENVFIWEQPNLTWRFQEYLDNGWDLRRVVEDVIMIVGDSDIGDKSSLDSKLRAMASKHRIDRSTLMRFIRRLLTNSETGLPVFEIFDCLGKIRLLKYLNNGLKYVST